MMAHKMTFVYKASVVNVGHVNMSHVKMIKIVDDFSKRNTNDKRDDDGEDRNKENHTHTTDDSTDEKRR